jgi:hypothetical protein
MSILKNEVPRYFLRFAMAILALAVSMIVSVIVFGLIGSLLFHNGLMSDAALFVFPWYGLLPGFIAGTIWYIRILVHQNNGRKLNSK